MTTTPTNPPPSFPIPATTRCVASCSIHLILIPQWMPCQVSPKAVAEMISNSRSFICHFSRPWMPICKSFTAHLTSIAHKYPHVKFVWCNQDKSKCA